MSSHARIETGQRIPEAVLQVVRDGVEKIDTHSIFAGRKVVMFGVPGAFTPSCSERHQPGDIARFDEVRARSARRPAAGRPAARTRDRRW